MAQTLLNLGVAQRENVAVLSQNSIAYAEIFMGILRAGACVTPLSSMASSDALEKMLDDCGARVLFLSDQYRGLVEGFLPAKKFLQIAIDFADGVHQPIDIGKR